MDARKEAMSTTLLASGTGARQHMFVQNGLPTG
jgi:hypothetical protein